MRRYLLAFSLVLPLGVIAPVHAQDAGPALSVSRSGAMSCRQFAGLSPSEQNRIVRRITSAVPPSSLSTNVTNGVEDMNGDTVVVPNRTTVPGTPLTAGELIADCQTATPQASLREAYASANSPTYNSLDTDR